LTAVGNLKEIKEFLHNQEKKTDFLNELGSDGWNPIHVAVLKENEEIILYFLEKYVLTKIENKNYFKKIRFQHRKHYRMDSIDIVHIPK